MVHILIFPLIRTLKTRYIYLSEPIANHLLFAGEATGIDTYGYTHGALLGARREVSRRRFVYNVFTKTECYHLPFSCPYPSQNIFFSLVLSLFTFVDTDTKVFL